MKNKNHVTISIGTGKAFDKIHHAFMIKKKKNQQMDNRRNVLQHNKSHICEAHS